MGTNEVSDGYSHFTVSCLFGGVVTVLLIFGGGGFFLVIPANLEI
jgi:hypothetical protein